MRDGLKPSAPGTSAYSEARSRLPEQVFHELFYKVANQLEGKVDDSMHWMGRPVKIVDGSTLLMPDTIENQAAFPQHGNQRDGSGFPIARIAAVFSLATGAVMDLAIGPYKGKKTGEHALVRRLLHCFNKGDVVLGDAYYCSYFLVALLTALGVDIVFEGHGARNVDFRRGKRLGKRDHLVEWRKPARPDWLDEEVYALIPDCLEMRECSISIDLPGQKSKQMVLVTTLKDSKKTSKIALGILYKQRWQCELNLRSIKTTLGMDMLRGKNPDMVRKEIWAHLLAYNIIRKVMMEAAGLRKVDPKRISFKGTVVTLCEYLKLWQYGTLPLEEVYPHILKAISQSLIPLRPGRSEPRAVKRRPKPFPRLQGKRVSSKTPEQRELQT